MVGKMTDSDDREASQGATAVVRSKPDLETVLADPRVHPFMHPLEVAQYWLMIHYLQFGIGALMLYAGWSFRIWWGALAVTLFVYAVFSLVLDQILYVQLVSYALIFIIGIEPSDPASRANAVNTIVWTSRWGDLVLTVLIYVQVWLMLERAEVNIVVYAAVWFLLVFTVRLLRHASIVAMQ